MTEPMELDVTTLPPLTAKRSRRNPLSGQIALLLASAIADLPAKTYLPPERVLAEHLGVNKSTAQRAYETLTNWGLVCSDSTRGRQVAEKATEEKS